MGCMNSGFYDNNGHEICEGDLFSNGYLVIFDKGNFWAINYKNQNNRKPLEEYIRFNSNYIQGQINKIIVVSILRDLVNLDLLGISGNEDVFGNEEIIMNMEDYTNFMKKNKLRINNDLDRYLDLNIQYLLDETGIIVGQQWNSLIEREKHYRLQEAN